MQSESLFNEQQMCVVVNIKIIIKKTLVGKFKIKKKNSKWHYS